MDSIALSNVVKDYTLGKITVPALKGVSLSIQDGEFTVIAGPSGSGKTTLLNLVGCVDVASKGDVVVAGANTGKLSEKELTDLRLHKIGFIFQSFNLISVLNVYDNVEFPLLLMKGLTKAERQARVKHFIDRVGLSDHMKHRPNELSGGQRQRVAIARALVMRPRYVFADEPTGSLDSANGDLVLALLRESNRERGTTVIMVTHDPDYARLADRRIQLADGKVAS